MATILVLFCGLVGFLAGIASLVVGLGPLTALGVWMAGGISATLFALVFAFRTRPVPAVARA